MTVRKFFARLWLDAVSDVWVDDGGWMKEKDIGAFDGQHWLVRSPRADGTVEEKCEGNCAALAAFLDSNGAPRR